MKRLIWLLLISSCFAQTWATWNGTTVGSSAGNVSGWNGTTIGTTAGNIGAWNGLTSPSSGGGAPALVNSGTYSTASITPTITITLAFTVSAHHFVFVSGGATGSFTCVTGITQGGTSMVPAATGNDAHAAEVLGYYLSDSVSSNQIVISTSGCSGSKAVFNIEEWSGLSTTATITNTAVQNSSGFVTTTSWSNSAYSVTGSGASLVESVCYSQAAGGTWTQGSGWTLGAQQTGGTFGLMNQYQVSVGNGSYTGQGTNSNGGGGTYYGYFTVAFK